MFVEFIVVDCVVIMLVFGAFNPRVSIPRHSLKWSSHNIHVEYLWKSEIFESLHRIYKLLNYMILFNYNNVIYTQVVLLA